MSMSKTQVQESLAFNLGGLLNPPSDRHLQDPEGGLEFVLDGFSLPLDTDPPTRPPLPLPHH